ncbi:MAG: folylpolyglutamate synthase/dihydrofolate synthase family protein [Candidatus Caldarchaeum sp.]
MRGRKAVVVTYQEALDYIGNLQRRGWRLGLDRMEEFLRLLECPHYRVKALHVAGTNGKGSVTAMLQSILKEAGYKVGGFFSPYVFDFRERIQLNCEYISESDVARLTAQLMPISEKMDGSPLEGPTEFEFKTAMGFLYWAEKNCDYVVLEVGLGGRLDATNVVNPLVSVITQIALDHQNILGNTVREIAREKAGIIKEGKPCVCVAEDPDAQMVVQTIAKEKDSELWLYGREIKVSRSEDGWDVETPCALRRGLRVGLRGDFQALNLAAAVSALDMGEIPVEEDALRKGLLRVSLPGRFQVVSDQPLVVLDGAHNPSAMEALCRALRAEFPQHAFRVVFSGSTGHDTVGTLKPLRTFALRLYLCSMQNERALSLKELKEFAEKAGFEDEDCKALGSPTDAFRSAIEECKENEGVLVTGSFYLLKEVFERTMVGSNGGC